MSYDYLPAMLAWETSRSQAEIHPRLVPTYDRNGRTPGLKNRHESERKGKASRTKGMDTLEGQQGMGRVCRPVWSDACANARKDGT